MRSYSRCISTIGISLLTALFAFSIAGTAHAVPILVTLSEVSNNEGELDGVDATELNATALFTVTGTTLTIVLTNTTDTLSNNEFDISAFVFNVNSDDISALTLTSFPNADGGYTQGTSVVGGFGSFDDGAFANIDTTGPDFEIGENLDLVNPGDSETFTYTFTCSGTCDEEDFVTPNGSDYTFAAKFINGGGLGGDSAWGGTTSPGVPIPEPFTASLLMLGLLGLGVAGRRSRPRS